MPESGRLSKLTYGCYLAACLAYFSSLQRDRVGMATFDHDIVDYVPPSAKHLQLILHTLDRVEQDRARREGDARQVDARCRRCESCRRRLRRRSLVVLISDFYEDADDDHARAERTCAAAATT